MAIVNADGVENETEDAGQAHQANGPAVQRNCGLFQLISHLFEKGAVGAVAVVTVVE